ncbi:hypothetical protein EX30DRAFT_310460 [Ascodesmis nigricans]|uniref:BZIP domain-containing protein n=1 Tax=Ascodesmis nigricans TaxID=341454 RepID=A0A4S2MM62_9PEZI|nr:hypothetical protein EX30DRAFT_310460 [Ascodesmis nigricans]
MNQVQQIPTPQSQARSLSPPASTTTDENDRDLTPGQRRRKEQNRAAQRAFRDRKERHLRTLESRLATLESTNTSISTENASLKAALEKARLENRILHETRSPPSSSLAKELEMEFVHGPLGFMPANHPSSQQTQIPTPEKDDDADDFDTPPPTSFTAPLFRAHPNRGPLHRITTSPATGERLLAAGAAWEMIICHPLYVQGKVDIVAVGERLKGVARCDGQGPVFEERDVLEAVQGARRRGEGLVEEDEEEGMW